jgi:hypothetical protein
MISFFLVEINKAALGTRWTAVFALWNADTFQRGETLFGGS